MFLKQGTFNYEKQSVVLSELSGLQRIEYLAFVQQRTAKFDAEEGELPEAERQIAFLRMGMDNMVAQGNVLPVLYGEMRVGSRVVSQEISTADEGDGGQVVVIGR